MKIFDQVDQGSVDRRELQLWILALTVILVMTVGMALLMYPAIFEKPVVLNGEVLKNVFFSFCALSFLLLGYLIDRQVVIRQLRRKLTTERQRIVALRKEASTDLMASMPGLERFRDCLAMEYRRASNSHQPISIVTVRLATSTTLTGDSEITMAYGDALKAITRKLRGEDSIYQIAPESFGMVLPGVSMAGASSVVRRLSEGLQDASGAESRFSFGLRVTNYPEQASSARELEEAVRSMVGFEESGNVAAQDSELTLVGR
jgi:GGDEF domain-containing protein